MKNVLKDFSCRGDIVFFAYFGHGSRAIDDKSDFPQLCLGSKNSDDFVPVDEVKRVLTAKGARLAIILADCCNSPDATTKVKRHVLSAASATTVSDKMAFVFKKLFLDTEGIVMGAGCKKGEYSWYYDEGSFFTDAFIDELENYSTSNTNNPTWQDVANNIVANVVKTSKNAAGVGDKGFVQTPIFYFSFDGNPKNDEPRIDEPKNDDPRNDVPKVDDETKLKTLLISVANDELEPSKRFSEEKKALKMFSENAEVIVVGRDHKTILESLSAEDYLARISTSSRLRNFSILDKKLNSSGRYTYLKIHEIYINK